MEGLLLDTSFECWKAEEIAGLVFWNGRVALVLMALLWTVGKGAGVKELAPQLESAFDD